MSVSWVGATVRARALASRRAGAQVARRLAAGPALGSALAALGPTLYAHDVRPGQTLAEAQHAVGATLLWHMRVLSGWAPSDGAEMLRALAGGFEVANTDVHLSGRRDAAREPYRLGTLSTAWARIARAGSPSEVAGALGASPWGDPGGDSAWAVQVGMRLSWAARVVRTAPAAASWARGAAALLVVRETALAGAPLPAPMVRRVASLLGGGFAEAAHSGASLADLRRLLPTDARWLFADVHETADLWRAESAWWVRVGRDGLEMLRGSEFGSRAVLGAVAVLAADAWRVRGALESAARGGAALEDFDAVA